jgi:hypothetical protein
VFYHGQEHLEFRRDRSKTNSTLYLSTTNQESCYGDNTDHPALATAERLGGCDAGAV